MRAVLPLVLTLTLIASAAPSAAAQTPFIDYDVADPEGDVVRAVRHPDTRELVARPSMDVTRVVARVDGDFVVQEFTMAGTPGEPNLDMEVVTFLDSGASGQFRVSLEFSSAGEVPATAAATLLAKGVIKSVEVAVAVVGNAVTLTFPAAELPDGLPCFHPTASLDVRGADGAEYSENVYPEPDLCNDADSHRDGISGECPPTAAPDGDDLVAHELTDDTGDVRQVSYSGEEDAENASLDITGFVSRRDGDRIVQTMTTAAPLPEGTVKVIVTSRVDGEKAALEATRFQFARNDPTPRAEGEATTSDGQRGFLVDASVDGNAVTFSFCASLVPADAPCFSPEVSVEATPAFGTTVGDSLAPAKNACAGKGAADGDGSEPAPGDDGEQDDGGDDPTGDGEVHSGDDETQDTPAPGAALVFAAIAGAVAFAHRRRN